MENYYTTKEACRVCGHGPLTDIISLGDLYVTNFVDTATESEQVRSPLDVVLCDPATGGCGLLQLKHTFSADVMYRTYWYRSGINQTMRSELAGIAKKVEEIVPLAAGDAVVDIGSNDSTELRSYTVPGLKLIGFEPSKNLMQYAEPGVTKVINDYFTHAGWSAYAGNAKAKAITAIAMFYDLDDPNAFVADIVKCLDDEGLFVVQQNYLPFMLRRNVFDNISHEHLEYYSLTTFKRLLDRHGLELVDVESNDVNGGSMRTYIRHRGKGTTLRIAEGGAERVARILADEEKEGLNDRATYTAFAARIDAIREKLHAFIAGEVAAGKRVYAYGASTRGNTLLQYCDLDHTLIVAAAERNPDKWGRKTVGTLIPIVSEEEARTAKPDYFLVLPWQFLDEFVKREAAYLSGGGKFIVPLPEFRVI